jgi:hypothetical protein
LEPLTKKKRSIEDVVTVWFGSRNNLELRNATLLDAANKKISKHCPMGGTTVKFGSRNEFGASKHNAARCCEHENIETFLIGGTTKSCRTIHRWWRKTTPTQIAPDAGLKKMGDANMGMGFAVER